MPESPSTEATVDQLLRRFGARASFVPVREDDVFVRTARGRLELIDRCSPLPRRLRMLLTLIDGRVSVAELRRGVSRYRSLSDALDMLRRMQLIEPRARRLHD
ncbi:MAG: hypothetical protein WCG13_07965 [Burkholderiales bacterium]